MKLLTVLLLFSFNISLSLSTNGCSSQWGAIPIPPIPYLFCISPDPAVLGIYIVLIIFLCGVLTYFSSQLRSLAIEYKEMYFRENGGLLLKQQISNSEGNNRCAIIFSAEELKKATNGYNSSRIVATVSNGTVYRGVLEDGTVVAVKKPRVMDWHQTKLFIDELAVLTRINHRNVVKLLGCCLETKVPMLVYEFLQRHAPRAHLWHHQPHRVARSYEDRYRNGRSASVPSLHHYNADLPRVCQVIEHTPGRKLHSQSVSFGISRLVPVDIMTEGFTLSRGIFGSLEPEYVLRYKIPALCDVYRFGVVLAELLLGQEAVWFDMPREYIRLADYFLSSLKSKELGEFIDDDVSRHGSADELRGVAELARKCLDVTWTGPLSMKEVSRELVRLRDLQK